MVSLKTTISVINDMYDLDGQWLPKGNYYFKITSMNTTSAKGYLTDRLINAYYQFMLSDVIKMMSAAQARLARRANITNVDVPDIASPVSSTNALGSALNIIRPRQPRRIRVISPLLSSRPRRQPPTEPPPPHIMEAFTRHELHNSRNTSSSVPPSPLVAPIETNTSFALPTLRAATSPTSISSERVSNSSDDTIMCTICMELIEPSNTRSLNCSHTFHKTCVERWLNNRNTCPLCRRVVRQSNTRSSSNRNRHTSSRYVYNSRYRFAPQRSERTRYVRR